MSKQCLYTILISISILFLVLSVGAFLIFSNIDYFINKQIKEQAPLVEGSKPLNKWSQPANDTKFRYMLYLFNVTNAKTIHEGENPQVQELGPYEFIQEKKWKLYNWDNNAAELNYEMFRTFYRDETCKGNLDDMVTVLNVPLVSFASLVKNKIESIKLNFLRKRLEGLMRRVLRKRDLFVTQRAGDILFNGYKDDFTKNIAFIMKTIRSFGIQLDAPSAIADDGTFSLLGQKNKSSYGMWTIDTGKFNLTELGRVNRIDQTQLNITCWKSPCNSIHGTDGLIHHPFIEDDDILPVFEPELNRTVFLNYERDSQYMGIPTKRFVLSELTYASPSSNPYNGCFCPRKDEFNIYNGTLKVGHCYQQVPMVFSNPHFYQGDEYFRTSIHGLKPNKAKHESFADISKELGMVINGRKTVQLNMDTEAHTFFEGGKRRIFPIFWLADSGSAGPSSIHELRVELYDKVETIRKYLIIGTAIFIAGFLVPLIYLVVDCFMYWRIQSEDTEQIINPDDDITNNNNNVQIKDMDDDIKDDHLNVIEA